VLPTFIIAGGPKCGTTALWKYLNEHPEIYLADWKEPKFFTICENDLGNNIRKPGPNRIPNYKKGLEWYMNLFDCDQNTKAIGEASTAYLSMPDSPFLIKKHLPDVKIIIILRDPVHRMFSHYWHNFKRGVKLPKFEEMVKNNHSGYKYYEYVSHYKQHLDRYLDVFDADQLKILIFEDLKNDPDSVYKEIFKFLNVEDGFVPESNQKEVNPYTIPRFMLIERVILITRFMKISQMIPKGLKKYLIKIRDEISKMNRQKSKYPKLSNDLYNKLIIRFEEDIQYVEKLLNRNLDIWRTP
jgi:hypothetical protein